jgi:hypothetical protein
MTYTRHGTIRDRLCAHLLDDCGCAVVCPPEEAWTTFPVAGHHRFGWLPPAPIDDDERLLLVSFCPGLLAQITAWLTDAELEVFLSVLVAFLDAYIDGFGGDNDEIRRQVENRLTNEYRDALALFSQVEARALDAGIVRQG